MAVGADAEAQHIVESIQALRGVAFAEDGAERGLSWSEMAILLRSVKANAEPITGALQAAGIPFVVTGMTNLFGTAEAEAARQLFYFMAGHSVKEFENPAYAQMVVNAVNYKP